MFELKPPPFRIYLLRHAQAAWANPGERDFDRKLDETGYAQAEMIADRAADKGYEPDIVISSTALRCRQTTEQVRRAFGETLEIAFVDEMYNAQAETYLALAFAQVEKNSLMLVGHNPTMEAVLEALIGTAEMEAHLATGFPTAGLAVLDFAAENAQRGEWRLMDFLAPQTP